MKVNKSITPSPKRPLRVLIVENDVALGQLWSRHLERKGMEVVLKREQAEALEALNATQFDVIILNLVLQRSSAFAIADRVAAIDPDIPVIFVSSTSFFSDGSIFSLCANARAHLNIDTSPEDLSAMVEHYGETA